jgi:MOSC domain-containing protein YiiM
VWKKPAEGPWMARRLNIDGDGQGDLAGHGREHRAAFVYQIDSYRYWKARLGRDDFTYGRFGENFTVDGLADDRVCIGDRYRIGAVVFEVTQPRVTCYRVGIRLDDPQIPALLISHHRPGVYLRVLREGAVQAGDEIVQVAAGPATGPRSRSPRSPGRCWPGWPAGTSTSASAARRRTTWKDATARPRGVSQRLSLPP